MIMCGLIDGPPYGYCRCGWALLADRTCSDAECPYAWGYEDEHDYEDEDEHDYEDWEGEE
jgi:hypothetical protein